LVVLVNPPTDQRYSQSATHASSFPALGVLALATAVQVHAPEWRPVVFDGTVQPLSEILRFVREHRPRLLGVSILATSYQNSMQIIRTGKAVGSLTVIGNDQAIVNGEAILSARIEVDYACVADIGEPTLIGLLEYIDGRRDLATVPSLLYRDSEANTLRATAAPQPIAAISSLETLPLPNRSLLSPSVRHLHLTHYLAHHDDPAAVGTATMNQLRGCGRWLRRCVYCSIADLRPRLSTPERFWKDVVSARESGANRIFEACDSFSSFPHYLSKLAATRPPAARDARLFVYSQAPEVNARLVDLYKKIGVWRVNMGLDSGDPEMLARLKNPHHKIPQTVRALRLLREADIRVYASFVLGGPGETTASLANTCSFIKWLVKEHLVDTTEAQPLCPLPGSKSWELLLSGDFARAHAQGLGFPLSDENCFHQMRAKWLGHENPDPDELSRDWARTFSRVSYERLLEMSEDIIAYSRAHGVKSASTWLPAPSQVLRSRLIRTITLPRVSSNHY
jgi:radical SAM superfamily enzyme YgiQ (UPF0313 family)